MSKETSEAIKKLVCEYKEVKGAYDLIVNSYGPERGIGSIHIEVDDTLTAKEIHPLTRKIATQVYQEFGIIMTMTPRPLSRSMSISLRRMTVTVPAW